MVDAATHREQLVELAGISADVALISAQGEPAAAGAGAGTEYSDLRLPIFVGRFLRWSLVNEVLAIGLVLFVVAAMIYGVASFAMAVGEVN